MLFNSYSMMMKKDKHKSYRKIFNGFIDFICVKIQLDFTTKKNFAMIKFINISILEKIFLNCKFYRKKLFAYEYFHYTFNTILFTSFN